MLILVPFKPVAIVLGCLSALILGSYFVSCWMEHKSPFLTGNRHGFVDLRWVIRSESQAETGILHLRLSRTLLQRARSVPGPLFPLE